jgi:hypothetical protein
LITNTTAPEKIIKNQAINHILKWLLPVLIIIEIFLVFSGIIDIKTAVGIIIGVELSLAFVGTTQIVRVFRRYKQNRENGINIWTALIDGLSVVLPTFAARAVVLEFQLWTSLFIWAFQLYRKPPDTYTYHKHSILGIAILIVLFCCPFEIAIFELIIPWAWLRWTLLILSIYSLIWVLGFYSSLVIHPHRIDENGVKLHFGAFADGFIPIADISEIKSEKRNTPKKSRGLLIDSVQSTAYICMEFESNITIELSVPIFLNGFTSRTTEVRIICISVDDPDGFIKGMQKYLTD